MTGHHKQGTEERLYGCMYLEEQDDDTYLCLIRSGAFKFDELDEKVKNYYLKNCVDYPDPEDPTHVPPIFTLLPECGFVIMRVEDDAVSD